MTTAIDRRGDVLEAALRCSAYSTAQTVPTALDARQPHRETLVIDCHEDRAGMGHAMCVWGGRTFTASSRNGAVLALCRILVKEGCPDLTWRTARGLRGRVHGAARLTVAGGERPTRFVPWKPGPGEP
jgi:hypothetical protein